MEYSIIPIPKPRMTKSDRWKKRPAVLRYWAFKEECKLKNVTFENGQAITYVLPMPKSWSAKKSLKMNEQPHTSRPDVDNLTKALFDALFEEDSHIWWIGETKKIWGYTGKIIII